MEKTDGALLLSYREASGHGLQTDGVIRFKTSDNDGETWTDNDATITGRDETDCISDAVLVKAPNGDLLCLLWTNDIGFYRRGERVFRSRDGGATWSNISENAFSSLSKGAGGNCLVVGNTIYVPVFECPTESFEFPFHTILYKSEDNGVTWEYVSDITSWEEGTNEAGLAYIENNSLLCLLRDDAERKTYQRVSLDMGRTWGALEDKTAQLGVLQRPVMDWFGDKLIAHGRVVTGGKDWPAWFFSEDKGENWKGPYFPDIGYTDAGYTAIALREDEKMLFVSYHGYDMDASLFQKSFYPLYPSKWVEAERIYAEIFNTSGNVIASWDITGQGMNGQNGTITAIKEQNPGARCRKHYHYHGDVTKLCIFEEM